MKKYIKWLIWCLVSGFLIINILAFNHAYKFSHFTSHTKPKTEKPEDLGFVGKIGVLITGISNPKPVLSAFPKRDYETISLRNNNGIKTKAWFIKAENPKGTVVMCHGYSANKSKILLEAEAFYMLGYNTFLIDLSGHGDSKSNTTTVGYREAEDVAAAFRYLKKLEQNEKLILYGVSMGAVAILRATADLEVNPDKIIIECPYGSMLSAAENRFNVMNLPSFPFAHLLVFWGGLQNGFWAFENNSILYATKIDEPVLLMYGVKDQRVTLEETKSIFRNLRGEKKLVMFEEAAHQSYLESQPEKWKENIKNFLQN